MDIRALRDRLGQISGRMAKAQAVILFSLLYYILVIPMAGIQHMFAHKEKAGWQRFSLPAETISDLRRQG